MKTIRIAQFLGTAAIITTLNVSAAITDNATTEVTGSRPVMADQKLSANNNVANAAFAAYNNGFGAISLADTGLTTTVSEPDKKPTFVPEPSTIIAGALLLVPFMASIVRVLRKVRTV